MKSSFFLFVFLCFSVFVNGQSHKKGNIPEIVTFQEKMPEFPGGPDSMNIFLRENMIYPPYELRQKISGRVVVAFNVEANGIVDSISIAKSVSPGIDWEAKRVIGLMPRWKPGYQDNKPVRVKYTLPMTFTAP